MEPPFVTPAYVLPQGAEHPKLRQAFDYWLAKAPPGLLPGRQHIDPQELKSILPNLFLVDVGPADTSPRFRVRLIGTALTEIIGHDLTGLYVDTADIRAPAIARMIRLAETRQPYYVADHISTPRREHIVLHRLAMPLAADGRNVDMIFACCIDEPDYRRAGH